MSFSPDANLILSSSDDKSVKLWDVATLKFKSSYIGHTNWVTTSEFSSDMTAIVSGGEDKKVMVWDTESKKCIQKYDCYESAITKTIFHPT